MKNTTITKPDVDQSLATPQTPVGLGIQGLEEEDASILPIPFVRVVQSQSKDIKMKDGKDAPEGWFLFSDTREAVPELVACILKSKVVVTDFERDGEIKPTTQRKIIAMTLDTKKVFNLTISVTSFGEYGRLVAEMKQNKVTSVWERIVTFRTEKRENDKGKFQVVTFILGEVPKEEDSIEMALAYEQFKNKLDASDEQPEEQEPKNDRPF